MFKVNNKNTRTMSVSIADFEQVNVNWEVIRSTKDPYYYR